VTTHYRPGTLTKVQLKELNVKQAEIDQYVRAKVLDWGVSAATICGNMGMDNRERRATSFWNKFQAVFWQRWHALREEQHQDAPEDTGKSFHILSKGS